MLSTIVVQLLSCVRLFVTPWTSTPGFFVLQCLLEFAQTHVHWVDDALQQFHPLHSLLFLLSVFPSIRIFSIELALRIRWPKYWSVSFSISPSNEYSGLISFGINWFNLLAVPGTLKSLLQHHSSKASNIWHSAFFMVLLSHTYMTTGKGHSFDYMDLGVTTGCLGFQLKKIQSKKMQCKSWELFIQWELLGL